MLSLKNSLKVLRKTKALVDGHFILSSGLHSGTYIQCAKLLSYPHLASKVCISLSKKIKKKFKKIDLILSPAIGGIILGYEIGRILKIETIFAERVNKKFKLRRGFDIKKGSRVLIIEDVITTGGSSLECSKLVKKSKAKVLGYASLIDRSNKSNLKIKNETIVSQIKINIPVFKKKELPKYLKTIPISTPGSRYLK